MTNGDNNTPSALGDVRVLDVTGEIGQYCTKLLADLGADVIKIEPPEGDPVRNLPAFYHDEPGPEHSLYWWNLNTNKRSVTVRIDTSEGQEVLRKLAATADVVVESFEPGYLAGLGLGYKDLSESSRHHPTSITGFGQTGPNARFKSPDIVGVAMGGTMGLAGDQQDPPNLPPWKQGFVSASIVGAAGTLTALLYRDMHGEGSTSTCRCKRPLPDTGNSDADVDMLGLRVRNGAADHSAGSPWHRRLRVQRRTRLRLRRCAGRRDLG